MRATICSVAAALALFSSWSVVPSRMTAQTVFEDNKGRTALFIPITRAVLGINTGDASAELSYFHLENTSPWVYGVAIKETATNGLGSFFDSKGWSGGTSARLLGGLEAGKHVLIGLRHQRDYTSTPLIDSTSKPVPTVAKPISLTWDFGVIAQYRDATVTIPFAAAIAVGGRRVNNYTDLPKVTLRTVRTSFDSVGNSASLERSTDGRAGTLTPEFVRFVDMDIIVAPYQTAHISFRLFGRGLYYRPSGSSQRSSAGMDIAFVPDSTNDPILDRKVALVLQVVEARPGDKETKLSKRTSLGIVADVATIVGALRAVLGP